MNNVLQPYSGVIVLAALLLVLSPFIWALAFKRDLDEETVKMVKENKANNRMVRILFALGFVIAWGFTARVFQHGLNDAFWQSLNIQMDDLVIAVVASLAYLLILRGISPVMHWYERIEKRFLDNMNNRQTLHSFVVPEILQENFVLEKMTLSAKSIYAGKHIRETDFHDAYDASVVSVDRADEVIDLPRRDFMLFPMDEITLLGTEEQLAKVRSRIEVEDDVLVKERPESDVDIYCSVVTKGDRYEGVTLHDSDLRNRFNVFVIAVERGDDFILNPESSITFLDGDKVWFVASESHAKEVLNSAKQPVTIENETTLNSKP